MKYKVAVREMLERMIEVEAKNAEYAIKLAEQMYINEEIILDENDVKDTEFEIIV